MGLLTEFLGEQKPEFNKERIIEEIKDGLKSFFPNWSWLTTPDYEFDLILVTTKEIKEEITNNLNPNSENKNVFSRYYQIARGVFITQQDVVMPQECNIGQLKIASARELFNRLRKFDEINGE